MKIKVISIALFLLFGITSNLKAEELICQVSYDYVVYPFFNYPLYSNNGSYKLGGNVSYYFNDRIAISSGLVFEAKKFLNNYGDNLIFKKETFDLTYLSFPLKMEGKLLNMKSNHLSIIAGVEFGFLLSVSKIIEYHSGATNNTLTGYNFAELIHNLAFGISYRYFLFENLFIGASPNFRYNVNDSQGIQGYTGQGTAYSFDFHFSFGYRFTLSKRQLPN